MASPCSHANGCCRIQKLPDVSCQYYVFWGSGRKELLLFGLVWEQGVSTPGSEKVPEALI